MDESVGGSWVEDCMAWTAKSVLEQMRAAAVEASRLRGVVQVGGRGSFGPAQTSELSDYGAAAGFVVELHGNGLLGSRGIAISFETKGSDEDAPFRNHDRIEAQTVIYQNGTNQENQETSKRVACLGLDCATGEPCLVDESGRRIPVEEFVREVLLPVLFPGMVAVDHSEESNRSAAA